jgi:membrane protein DedA with SNARE-associated domain
MNFDPIGAGIAWIGAYGLLGFFVLALAERFVPAIPSYGLLLALGIGAADGNWLLPATFLSTAAGGIIGCAASFYALRTLGAAQSARVLNGAGQLVGISIARIERGTPSFRRNQTALAFGLQLVPTVRLFAPAFAALLRGNSRWFLAASAAGIAVWNGLFIGIGYFASQVNVMANTTVVALAALGCLLVAEATLFWIARWVRAHRTPGASICETL